MVLVFRGVQRGKEALLRLRAEAKHKEEECGMGKYLVPLCRLLVKS